MMSWLNSDWSARGDGALWVGSDWRPPATAENLEQLVRVRWLGVWSESRDAAFAAALST